jgi:hypothetical protein
MMTATASLMTPQDGTSSATTSERH